MKRFILGILLMGPATQAMSGEVVQLNPKRTINIIDSIGGEMEGKAQTLDRWSRESKDPVDILINSPGGGVFSGYQFVDAMHVAQSRGVTIRCVVGSLAASMAFVIFTQCDERYSLPHAMLLFHPISVGTRERLTLNKLKTLVNQLGTMEDSLSADIQHVMGVSKEWFRFHYEAETMWQAESLLKDSGSDWFKVITDVKGTDKLFVTEEQRALPFPFGSSPDQEPVVPRIPQGPAMQVEHQYDVQFRGGQALE